MLLSSASAVVSVLYLKSVSYKVAFRRIHTAYLIQVADRETCSEAACILVKLDGCSRHSQ